MIIAIVSLVSVVGTVITIARRIGDRIDRVNITLKGEYIYE